LANGLLWSWWGLPFKTSNGRFIVIHAISIFGHVLDGHRIWSFWRRKEDASNPSDVTLIATPTNHSTHGAIFKFLNRNQFYKFKHGNMTVHNRSVQYYSNNTGNIRTVHAYMSHLWYKNDGFLSTWIYICIIYTIQTKR
jgi:hypothetical protein